MGFSFSNYHFALGYNEPKKEDRPKDISILVHNVHFYHGADKVVEILKEEGKETDAGNFKAASWIPGEAGPELLLQVVRCLSQEGRKKWVEWARTTGWRGPDFD